MAHVNWTRQLGLATALFVLGMGAYWLEYKHKPDRESKEEQTKHVFQLKDVPVKSIQLTDGSKSFAFACSDLAAKLCKATDHSKWEVSSPAKFKGDDSNINSLLSNLNNLVSEESIDLKDETPEKRASLLKEYGLDPNSRKTSRKVNLVSDSGETTLYLGTTHPVSESFFALTETAGKMNENLVYLVPNHFKANLEHDLAYWRNKKLFTVGAHEVQSIKLDGTQAHLSAVRKDGEWILTSKGEEMAGDIENIDNLLSAATFLSAKTFASDNKNDPKAKKALKGFPPFLTLTLQKEKGSDKEAPTPVVLTLYGLKPTAKNPPQGKLYGTVSNLDPLFELEPGVRNRLDKAPKDLRLTRLITSMDRFNAKKIEFSGTPIGEKPISLKSGDGKWISADPAFGELSQDKVQEVLEKLSGNRIKDFLTGSAIPTGDKEGLKVVLGDEKDDAKRAFLFWKKGTQLYGRDLRSKRNEAFLIDPTVLNSLPWDGNFLKKSETPVGAKSEPSKK